MNCNGAVRDDAKDSFRDGEDSSSRPGLVSGAADHGVRSVKGCRHLKVSGERYKWKLVLRHWLLKDGQYLTCPNLVKPRRIVRHRSEESTGSSRCAGSTPCPLRSPDKHAIAWDCHIPVTVISLPRDPACPAQQENDTQHGMGPTTAPPLGFCDSIHSDLPTCITFRESGNCQFIYLTYGLSSLVHSVDSSMPSNPVYNYYSLSTSDLVHSQFLIQEIFLTLSKLDDSIGSGSFHRGRERTLSVLSAGDPHRFLHNATDWVAIPYTFGFM